MFLNISKTNLKETAPQITIKSFGIAKDNKKKYFSVFTNQNTV